MMTELIPGIIIIIIIIIIIADCGRIVEISYPFVYSTFSDCTKSYFAKVLLILILLRRITIEPT